MDRDGRLADRSFLTFMGWSPGQAVEVMTESGSILLVRTDGSTRIGPRGHLRLPLTKRRSAGINTGDRVLIVAKQERGEILVIPIATVDDMVTIYRRSTEIEAGR